MPIRDGQTSHQAVAATLQTAQAADAAGYTRYWLAEHHNTPTFAITTPSIAIAHIASQTDTIRVGAGGVMLPVPQSAGGGRAVRPVGSRPP